MPTAETSSPLVGAPGHRHCAWLRVSCRREGCHVCLSGSSRPEISARTRLTQVACARNLCDMNLTLSIDEALAERARAVAAGRGKSLNQLVRDLLEAETGLHDGADQLRVLNELWATSSGHSGGARFSREDAYDGRMK